MSFVLGTLFVRKKNKLQRRRSNKRWIFALVVVVLFFGLIEGALRGIKFRYDPFMDAATWWVRFDGNPIFIADPILFWRLKPNANAELDPNSPATHRINSEGFRDSDFAKNKSPGEFRVITMGDSCTFGDGVADWETFANVLEKNLALAMPDKKVTIINAGVPGYTSYQVLTYLQEDLLQLKPDVVTVYVGLNDNVPATNSVPDANRRPKGTFLYSTFRAARTFRFVQALEYLVAKHVRPIRQKVESTEEGHHTFRVPFTNYVENLCKIKKLGDEHGFKVIIMTLPHTFKDESERNPFIRKAALQCSIPMIDLWHKMKTLQNQGESLYEPDGGHPNTLGHKRIAQFVQEKIAQMGKSPQPKPNPLPVTNESENIPGGSANQ